MDIKNKVVVITGASRGLGFDMAKIFSEEGATLVISDVLEDELGEVARTLGASGVVTDVTHEDEVRDLAETAIQKYGRIDLWINNAGKWLPYTPIDELDSKRVHEIMEVNFFGTMYGSQQALRQMKKQGSGMIVNIISVSALEGRPNSGGYCATKFAQDGFTKTLRKEAAPLGVTVLAYYPGKMNTHLYNECKLPDYGTYLDPAKVAKIIVDNIKISEPKEEVVIREV